MSLKLFVFHFSMRIDRNLPVLPIFLLLCLINVSFSAGSRLDYADRVYLVAQWVMTHLFYDKQSILYQTTGPNGSFIREYRMKLHLNGSLLCFSILSYYLSVFVLVIVADIKSVQKNRGDSDTKYLHKLVLTDEALDVEVPSNVLLGVRKRSSPLKQDRVDFEGEQDDEVDFGSELNSVEGGVEGGVEGSVGGSVEGGVEGSVGGSVEGSVGGGVGGGEGEDLQDMGRQPTPPATVATSPLTTATPATVTTAPTTITATLATVATSARSTAARPPITTTTSARSTAARPPPRPAAAVVPLRPAAVVSRKGVVQMKSTTPPQTAAVVPRGNKVNKQTTSSPDSVSASISSPDITTAE
jgi:hypothetical protein